MFFNRQVAEFDTSTPEIFIPIASTGVFMDITVCVHRMSLNRIVKNTL